MCECPRCIVCLSFDIYVAEINIPGLGENKHVLGLFALNGVWAEVWNESRILRH